MIIVKDCIVSDAIVEECFCCDLQKCKGICCIEGDSGAPLDEEEIGILEDCLDEIKPFMTEEGLQTVEDIGVFDYDIEGHFCTPLNNGNECAFLIMEGDMAKCAIEKAWEQQLIPFQKPISCHLYPIRITEYDNFTALNYDEWDICSDAKEKGEKCKLPIYEFLKTPLTRKFGEEWCVELNEKIKHRKE